MNNKFLVFVLLIFLGVPGNTFAQKDFSELTPKQKIRLGKKEQKAAKKDAEYLQLMSEALVLFQQKEYDKANSKYDSAHKRRPNNVYPLIMMDDIEIAKNTLPTEPEPQEEFATQIDIIENEIIEPEETPEVVIEPLPLEVESKEEVKEEIVEDIPVHSETIVDNTPEKIEKQIVIVPKPEPVKPTKFEEPVYENDGVYRETLKEGSATIQQITIVEEGKSTVIRKVSHSWGAVYYFLNKEAITKQEYQKLVDKLEE